MSGGEGPKATQVGSRKQLFIDSRFIESSEGITLTVNAPYQTGEELLTIDQPWEAGADISSYSSVLKEDGPTGPRIRLWYGMNLGDRTPATGMNPVTMAVSYAESEDGLHFRKPILNLVSLNDSRHNNLVFPPDLSTTAVGGGSVQRDDNPNCPPAERYKSWSKIYSRNGSTVRGPHRLWLSPDGLKWKLSDVIPTGLRAADTQPSWFWDSRIGRYIGYSREWVQFGPEKRIRGVSYNESDDMLHWDSMSIALMPDARDFSAFLRPLLNPSFMHVNKETISPATAITPGKSDDVHGETVPQGEDLVPMPGAPVDFYGPGVFPYKEAEDVYIALIPAFYHWRSEDKHTWPDTADAQLGVSRDGRHFERPGGRKSFLRLGPEGRFDSKWIWPMPAPIRMGDELWIYYLGSNSSHGMQLDPKATQPRTAISRAVLRLDGFVSVDAAYEGGSLTTPPIVFEGSHLELNLDTSAGGVARVEILDASGKQIDGYSLDQADQLNGNSVRLPASWRGKQDVSLLMGKPVKLHFELRNCKLYAFQFVR